MTSPMPGLFDGRPIVVADEDPELPDSITGTLRDAGHAVFRADDSLHAAGLVYALDHVALLLTSASALPDRHAGALIRVLRECRPHLPILFVASVGWSPPALEWRLPADVPVLREPVTGEELLAAVRPLLARRAA
jgi:DNA-binding response OmpR family regulator